MFYDITSTSIVCSLKPTAQFIMQNLVNIQVSLASAANSKIWTPTCNLPIFTKKCMLATGIQFFASLECRGFIMWRAPGKLTGCERDLAINLPGCFCLLFLLSFIRKTKNARLKNPTDLPHKT